MLAGFVVLAVVIWFGLNLGKDDTEAVLAGYANRYAAAVAFVVVDYRLLEDTSVVYRNRTEGTAFLVDPQGYLLTNRHVACPWLEDSTLYMLVNRFEQLQRTLRFDYRMYLWFEGAKAFQRLPGLSDSAHLADVYDLDSAYSNHKSPYLTIAGVADAPVTAGQLIKSPLRNDFAVLKIDILPPGLQPLPLDLEMDAASVARLSPVITLGFPLGSRTQADSVNVSVTRGNVRRSFEELLQVDVSLHGGNSGGPLIDTRGKVVGLASGVAVTQAPGPLPVTTPLSDMGHGAAHNPGGQIPARTQGRPGQVERGCRTFPSAPSSSG